MVMVRVMVVVMVRVMVRVRLRSQRASLTDKAACPILALEAGL